MEQKPHKPTPTKLRQARRQGKVVKSQLLTQGVVVLPTLLLTPWIYRFFMIKGTLLVEYTFTEGFQSPIVCLQLAAAALLWLIGLPLLLAAMLGLMVEFMQTGWNFRPSLVVPQWNRIMNGALAKRFRTGLFELLSAIAKLFLLAGILFWFSNRFLDSYRFFLLDASADLSRVRTWVLESIALSGSIFLVFGGIDYFMKRRQYFRELSMSEYEVRREFRNEEGDPTIRALRRAEHTALLQQDIVARIRKAKVVVVEKEQ